MKTTLFVMALILGSACGLGFASAYVEQASPETRLYLIDAGPSNVYLLRGSKDILVDTGPPKAVEDVEKQLLALGVSPASLSLIILTHGHGDHGGGTAYFQQKYGIPVLAGKEDAAMMAQGANPPLQPQSFMGRVLKNMVDYPFAPYTPDLWLSEPDTFSLQDYGIAGRVINLPGHTAGSLTVLLDNGDALVGDLLRGGMLARHKVRLHFFHENRLQAEQQLQKLLEMGVRTFYPGHWGPISEVDVRKDYPWLQAEQ